MPWPPKTTRVSATAEEGANTAAHGNQYYGPYNKLLHSLFSADSDFIVSPNYIPGDDDGGADFIVSFEINLRQRPVLVLEVKPPQHLSLIYSRGRQPTGRFAVVWSIFQVCGVVADCALMTLPPISFLQDMRPSLSSAVSAQ